jgi:hypothetical protein
MGLIPNKTGDDIGFDDTVGIFSEAADDICYTIIDFDGINLGLVSEDFALGI